MTNRLCMQNVNFIPYRWPSSHLTSCMFLFRLTFCNSNIIHVLFVTSCRCLGNFLYWSPSVNVLMIFVSGSIQVFTILIILVSYTLVLLSFKEKSAQGIRKAFSTSAGAHLLSVSLYYGNLLFMYVRPGSTRADDRDMMDSLFTLYLIPFLNPIIYSLRNKKVKNSLTENDKRNILDPNTNMCVPP